MTLDSRTRKSLLAQSHALRPAVTLSADRLTDAAVTQVREAFREHELLKIRIHADTAAECDAAAQQLAARLPCELVKRIGRVVILFRATGESDR